MTQQEDLVFFGARDGTQNKQLKIRWKQPFSCFRSLPAMAIYSLKIPPSCYRRKSHNPVKVPSLLRVIKLYRVSHPVLLLTGTAESTTFGIVYFPQSSRAGEGCKGRVGAESQCNVKALG